RLRILSHRFGVLRILLRHVSYRRSPEIISLHRETCDADGKCGLFDYSESVPDNVLLLFLRPFAEKELNNELKCNVSRICWVMRFKEVIVLLCFSAALLVSCEKNSEIKVYRVSKAPLVESAPQQQDAMPTNTAAPRMPGSLASVADTSVSTPPNWEPQ